MVQKTDLSGDWEVTITQKIKSKKLTFTLFCTLSHIGDQVIGLLVFDIDRIQHQFNSVLKNDRKFDVQLQGEVFGHQLRMQYTNLQREIHQFGSFIATIESSDRIDGLFIGFGPESEGLISGAMQFKRV